MEQSTKFIHASDLHLGAHQFRNEYRANDFINAFQEILQLSIQYNLDFIVLGGDVFTSLELLPGRMAEIINLIREFRKSTEEKIPIITIEGNHDIRKFSMGKRFRERGQSWLKVLASLGLIVLLDADLNNGVDELFKEYDFTEGIGGKIKIKDSIIYGTRYLGEKPTLELEKISKGINRDNGCFNVLLQHFGIEGQMENVPGLECEQILTLRDKVDYLALGHFHKPFILDDWIYNPGSTEAACTSDHSFDRGVFLVEVLKNHSISKKVRKIKLKNRAHKWQAIKIPFEYYNSSDLYDFIIKKLKYKLKHLNSTINPSDLRMPILYLILKGIKPATSCKIKDSDLSKKILEQLPVVDVRIYKQFSKASKTLDAYL